MKQNTAMQEMLQYLDNMDSYGCFLAKDKATELLKKEEEQIVEAYNDGEGKVVSNGQKYFNQTYNNQ